MDRSVVRLVFIGIVAGLALLYYLIPVIYRALRSGVRNRQIRRQESGDSYRPIGLMVVAFFGLGIVVMMGVLAYIGVFEDGRWWAVIAGLGAFVVALMALYGVCQLFRGRRTGALIAFVALGASFGFFMLFIGSNDAESAGVVGMIIVALITWYVWSRYSRLQPDSFSERYFSANTVARIVLLLVLSAALSAGVTSAILYLGESTYSYHHHHHHYDDDDDDGEEDEEDDDYYDYNDDY